MDGRENNFGKRDKLCEEARGDKRGGAKRRWVESLISRQGEQTLQPGVEKKPKYKREK